MPKRFEMNRLSVRKRVANAFSDACQWISAYLCITNCSVLYLRGIFSVAVSGMSYSRVKDIYD